MKQVRGVPRCVLGDGGTENVYICALQHFFFGKDGTDAMAGEKSSICEVVSLSPLDRSLVVFFIQECYLLVDQSIFLKI